MRPQQPQPFIVKLVGGGEDRFLLDDVLDLDQTTPSEVTVFTTTGKRFLCIDEHLMVTIAKPAVVDRRGLIDRIRLAQKLQAEG